jgi:HEAT repeat protein
MDLPLRTFWTQLVRPSAGVLALAALACAGCELANWRSADEALQAAVDQAPGGPWPVALQSDAWVHAVPDGNAVPDSSKMPSPRWHNAALRAWHEAGDRQVTLRAALASGDPVVSTNAAVLLARAGDAAGGAALAAAVENTQLRLPARLAAAEALGSLAAEPQAAALRRLAARSASPNARSAFPPELQAELVRAVAAQATLADGTTLLTALRSDTASVRLAALSAWDRDKTELVKVTVFQELLRLRDDADPAVRAALLAVLARHRHPQAVALASAATADISPAVRGAAIDALGRTGGPDAIVALRRLLDAPSDQVRSAAVPALAAAGARDEALAAGDDSSFRVRLAVARLLGPSADPAAVRLAVRFAADPSPAVQEVALEALATWPAEQASPALWMALERGSLRARRAARDQLARHWPPAGDLNVDGALAARRQALAELKARWPTADGSTFAPPEPRAAGESPVAVDSAALGALLNQLDTDDVDQRRLAASALAAELAGQSLPPDMGERLAGLIERDSDAEVWRDTLAALAGDGGPAAVRLACAGLGHPDADVRRRCCEHLGRHGGAEHAPVLCLSLADGDPSVVRAATVSLGWVGDGAAAAALEPLLASADRETRLAAAVALVRLKQPAGVAACERLAADGDPQFRRRVALSAAELADPALVPLLVRMLDDHIHVRQAALAALAATAGRDVAAEQGVSADDEEAQSEIWRLWAIDQGGAAPAVPGAEASTTVWPPSAP